MNIKAQGNDPKSSPSGWSVVGAVLAVIISSAIAFCCTCYPLSHDAFMAGINIDSTLAEIEQSNQQLGFAQVDRTYCGIICRLVCLSMFLHSLEQTMKITYRNYTYLGSTQSLCPECLALVPAKIVERNGRVYFRKRCPAHGPREDFVCSDVGWFDRTNFSLPGKVPFAFGIEPQRGCPYDCGLCTEHEQHTCLGLLEITSACNLECPMCFAASGPDGVHLSIDDCRRAIDRLVEVEGQPEILQLSGGEPTIHPAFFEIFEYACDQPIDIVMVNTNGIRLAHDRAFVVRLAEQKHRAEIYLQFDGFDERGIEVLRGESLVETKLRAIEALGAAGLHTTLVCTLHPGVNEREMGRIVQFGTERSWITALVFSRRPTRDVTCYPSNWNAASPSRTLFAVWQSKPMASG